jgi:hypothetical protein
LRAAAFAVALACAPPRPALDGPVVREWADPNLGRVLLHLPAGGAPPNGLVLALGVAPAELPPDVAVAAVEDTAWQRRAEGRDAPCWYLAGPLDTLGRRLAAEAHVPWTPPWIVARGHGSQLAWLAWNQAAPGTFAGLALGGLCTPLATSARVCGHEPAPGGVALPSTPPPPHPDGSPALFGWRTCDAMAPIVVAPGGRAVDDPGDGPGSLVGVLREALGPLR